jgi:NAD(P)-dependent dehydrogenase (short-subunit alcohol dehydrogenase family)
MIDINKINECIAILNTLSENPDEFVCLPKEVKLNLLKSSGKLSRPERIDAKKRNKSLKKLKQQEKKECERLIRDKTGIRAARQEKVFTAPKQIEYDSGESQTFSELPSPRNCYVCKKKYTKLHFFYDSMCPECAEFNYKKRFQTAPLDGQVAIITGSRLKIGYQATLMMLRAGATVIATTRFPIDSAERYAKEKDFNEWSEKLHIFGLDLRHTPSVEIFCEFIKHNFSRLDLIINNAAQTVRRPPGFYAHLMDKENSSFDKLSNSVKNLLKNYQKCTQHLFSLTEATTTSKSELALSWKNTNPGIGISKSAQLSQIPYSHDTGLKKNEVFPMGKVDADLQQVDLRKTNSWRLVLGEVSTAELLEIHLVNAIAPFVLCDKLISFMKKDNTGQKHIVNVSAMEGKFLRFKKGARHPHTNMAKAALNMFTHSSSSDLIKYGIHMNAVDTGWVTDEDPTTLNKFKKEVHDFEPPLDIVDGAARVCDPFFHGILTGIHWNGKFLKDYFPIDW